MNEDKILVANTSFPEVDQIAAAIAQAGFLSRYVRPYVCIDRSWEKYLERIPGLETFYARSFGRRRLPHPLTRRQICQAGIVWDFIMALHVRLPSRLANYSHMNAALTHERTNAVAQKTARCLSDEKIVISSWGCGEPVFRRMKARGGFCVLNYPMAHHRFTHRYLLQEAEFQPDFAETLNGLNYPKWLEARLDAEIDLADRIIVGSSFARKSFVKENVPAEKIVVIPYGADTHWFRPRKAGYNSYKTFRLLFVGQIGQRKGISYLFEAVRRMEGKYNSLTLVGQIQGGGRSILPYHHLFRHIPHVPHGTLREIYREADVFVFPTLVEGMPIAVLEAMASGLPIVTTPNGPGDIVRDGVDGFLVPPRNVEAIIDRLDLLRREPDLLAWMGRNARERALMFTWNIYREKAVCNVKKWLKDAVKNKDVNYN